MAAASGTLGSKLFITDAAILASVSTEELFTAQLWTEVGLIESFGNFGRVFTPVTFQAVEDGRTYKLKGGFDDGNTQFTLGQDLTDAGQFILFNAANDPTQNNFGFRIELNDAPSGGGPTTYFFRGLPLSFQTQMGAVNTVVKAMSTVDVNSPIIELGVASLYDRFINGETLGGYNLFKGSDAAAALPVVTGNALVEVTGAGSGTFGVDGSQLIDKSFYVLSGGKLVLEARVELSAVTNVEFFFGLTNQTAALIAPFEGSGVSDGVTHTAVDGVGFLFDTIMATKHIWLVGQNNSTPDTSQDSGLVFAPSTLRTLRMEIATNGDTVFFIDGVAVGTTMSAAVRTSVDLYPTISTSARTTTSLTGTADYLYARQG